MFVLDLPPHSSLYLGPEGGLGGIAGEAVAGMWRTLGLSPPSEADHIGALLSLYAHLGESEDTCRTDAAGRRLEHARRVLLWEHICSWAPAYLAAVADQPQNHPAARQWAMVLSAALDREAASSGPPEVLPAALLDAPPALGDNPSLDALVGSLTTPASCGFILTFSDLARCAGTIGVGLRRGERRFALRAMLEQDPNSTLSWLAGHARSWENFYTNNPASDRPGRLISDWWALRAAHSAALFDSLL